MPEFWQRGLVFLLIACGAVSVFYVGEFSPLPMTWILDAWIIGLLGSTLVRRSFGLHPALVLVALYAAVRIAEALVNDAPPVDFLQAYRWMLYLFAFALVIGLRWTRRDLLLRLTWWLAALATLKAGLTLIFYGPDQRPGLFLENNFELALFCGLAVIVYDDAGRRRVLLVALLGALTLLSGSRSGAVVYLLLVLYAVVRADLRDAFLRFLAAAVPLAVIALPVAVFRQRAAEAEVIDRVRFLAVFTAETADRGLQRWLTGTPPLTPLSPGACTELAFYEALFSSRQDGTCYSVILHAFGIRILYDAGLLGLALALLVPLAMMIRARVDWMTALVLVGIAWANSLSVSGLNNPYVALPILLAITLGPRRGKEMT